MLRKKEKEHRQEKNEGFNPSLNKILLFIFLLLLLSQFTYKVTSAQENSDLGIIEEKIFHQKFETEPKEERISRLEMFLFGVKQPNQDLENRLTKILSALKSPKKEPEQISAQTVKLIPKQLINERPENDNEPRVVYDESFNTGVVGAVSQIENKVFNMTFNEVPFPTRVATLEERLLSRSEIVKSRKKPLMERVTILIQKANIRIREQREPQSNYQYNPPTQNYAIDPQTGSLINTQTGEIVRDNYGNPIVVMLPQPLQQGLPLQPQYGFQLPPNQRNPYGFPNQLPGGQVAPGIFNPLDYLYNQGNIDPNADPGY